LLGLELLTLLETVVRLMQVYTLAYTVVFIQAYIVEHIVVPEQVTTLETLLEIRPETVIRHMQELVVLFLLGQEQVRILATSLEITQETSRVTTHETLQVIMSVTMLDRLSVIVYSTWRLILYM